MRHLKSAAAVVAASLAASVLAGCSSGPSAMSAPSKDRAIAPPSEPAPTTAGAARVGKAAQFRTNMQAARPKYYGLPTLERFARNAVVSDVVTGTVLSAESRAADGSGFISTTMTVRVEGSRLARSGSTIKVLEPGGVVSAREVEVYLEQKLGRPLTADERSEPVEVTFEDQAPAAVGDKVLLVLSRSDAGAPYQSLVRMSAADGSSVARSTGDTFGWPGPRPNDEWAATVNGASLIDAG